MSGVLLFFINLIGTLTSSFNIGPSHFSFWVSFNFLTFEVFKICMSGNRLSVGILYINFGNNFPVLLKSFYDL